MSHGRGGSDAASATAAGVAFARGANPAAAAKPAAARPPCGGILAGIPQTLAGLGDQRVIHEEQADGGSIDPKTLTASDVVSDTQMRAVADAIEQLEQADAR